MARVGTQPIPKVPQQKAPRSVSLARREQDNRAGVSYCWDNIGMVYLHLAKAGLCLYI